MKRSTGLHKCSNCDWEYDPAKGDSFLIGGMIKPGTPYEELPSNWRCPTCRASKDSFVEVVEEIPGFEVSGYLFCSTVIDFNMYLRALQCQLYRSIRDMGLVLIQ